MDHRARFSTLSASYDDFLFAPVCEEANGMRLSVLSALARMNVDPWEEAGRLAAMPKAIAEKTLLSALDRVSGRSWKSPEAAAIAARLVQLLPHPDQAGSSTAPVAAKTAAGPNGCSRLTAYWWVWLVLSIAMLCMMAQHQDNTTSADVVTSTPGATIPSKSSSVSDSVGQSR